MSDKPIEPIQEKILSRVQIHGNFHAWQHRDEQATRDELVRKRATPDEQVDYLLKLLNIQKEIAEAREKTMLEKIWQLERFNVEVCAANAAIRKIVSDHGRKMVEEVSKHGTQRRDFVPAELREAFFKNFGKHESVHDSANSHYRDT